MNNRYHPFYCEENIWHLGQNPNFKGLPTKTVFISNPTKTCAMWRMKAGGEGPVIWDYHVIFLCRNPEWRVWDLDSLLGCPVAIKTYLAQSFRQDWPEPFLPLFRVVDGPIFQRTFSSDRRHMIRPGQDLPEDPPPWSPIYNGSSSNLSTFIDMENHDFHGQVMDRKTFELYLGLT